MKNDDLLSARLAGLSVPPLDLGARDRTLRRAVDALRTSRPSDASLSPEWAPVFFVRPSIFAGAMAGLLALLSITVMPSIRQRGDAEHPPLTQESVVLAQMETLFGSRLDAVIEPPDGIAPDIRLSAEAVAVQPSLAQPVFIEFRRAGQHATRVLSYSGRKICVMLEDRRTCFEPLVTGRGAIILDGEHFYWASNQPSDEIDGYRVTACPLPRS